jgi:cyclopropane-fatty-acyl-phospholipid synthase
MNRPSQILKMDAAALKHLPDVPVSMRLVGRMLLQAKSGALMIGLPDGRSLLFDSGQPGSHADLSLHNFNIFSKAIEGGDVGLGESYMNGDWSTSDLTTFLDFLLENLEAVRGISIGRFIGRWVNRARHVFNRNSRAGSRRNIQAHYDLGNDFYEAWLDPSMTYSSAKFSSPDLSLEAAQTQKYKAICDQLQIGSGSRILEIGCGWGGFAEHAAAERGAHVTCLTLSNEQYDYAAERAKRAGLSDQIDIRLQDYRDHTGSYDGIASIEMFEAVGEEYWPSYFSKVQDCLKPGARAALQIITMNDDLFQSYRKRADFIQRYIFPGGMLPSHKRLLEEFGKSNLSMERFEGFALDYSKTLKLWAERFNDQWHSVIEPLGFDDRFRRMWNFYLSYCETGFQNGRIDVVHYTLQK